MKGITNTTTLAHLLWQHQFGSMRVQSNAKQALNLIAKPLFLFFEKQALDEDGIDADAQKKYKKRLHKYRLFLIAYGIHITHNIDEFNRLTFLDARGEIKIAYKVERSWNEEYLAMLEAITGNCQSDINKLPRVVQII